jgi:hypothetical protein
MTIMRTDASSLDERTNQSYIEITTGLLEQQEIYLRRQFDCALIDSTALACIKVAKDAGFDKLAEEIETDFKIRIKDV